MEPTPWVIDHTTCWLVLPVTDAVNCSDCPADRWIEDGETEMETEGALVPPAELTAFADNCTCARSAKL
jgi:hypothetical protein